MLCDGGLQAVGTAYEEDEYEDDVLPASPLVPLVAAFTAMLLLVGEGI